MVCPTSLLSSSLALSLLRHSSSPSQSFVLSPFSLNTALSIVHDGAKGTTQKELTELLLKGCTPSDVTNLYSTMALNILNFPFKNGVSFKSANRLYVDQSISLKSDFKKHVQSKYHAEVQNLKLSDTSSAAEEINNFVDQATNGKIKKVIKSDRIPNHAKAMLINAVHFLGNWKFPFNAMATRNATFKGVKGDRQVPFMNHYATKFRANQKSDFGTVLVLPYKDEKFNFFYLMPKESSNLEKLRNELTGEKLLNVVKEAKESNLDISVPKFKIESELLGGVNVLSQLGVQSIFGNKADLSKISSTPLEISKISHKAVIETDELGTEAAAATDVIVGARIMQKILPKIVIDRPFIFGVVDSANIIFLGQFV